VPRTDEAEPRHDQHHEPQLARLDAAQRAVGARGEYRQDDKGKNGELKGGAQLDIVDAANQPMERGLLPQGQNDHGTDRCASLVAPVPAKAPSASTAIAAVSVASIDSGPRRPPSVRRDRQAARRRAGFRR
jgi:hypothetical protein